MRVVAVLAALVVGACGTPTPQITLALATGDAQACPDDCAMIALPCDAVMSIRIVDPEDPYNPAKRYLSQCERIRSDKKNDVCSLNMVNLDSVPLPVRDLAVQIAVFPGAGMAIDPETNDPVCPDVQYAATGLPVVHDTSPALGGQAYYHPGDQVVTVVLGCTDLSAVKAGESCSNPTASALTATVNDFDTRVPVRMGPEGADQLIVSVGEPHVFDGGYVFNPADAIPLRLDDEEVPRWTAAGSQSFRTYACVDVLEDAPQAVATLRCGQPGDAQGNLSGMWIKKLRLQGILDAFSLPSEFPTEGLTIGMVVDAQAQGLADYTVTTTPSVTGGSPGTVSYLPVQPGAPITATSKTGIFMSRDAPFGTVFSARGQSMMAPAVGGLVAGKVTVVLIAPMGSR